jgi:hypothetical protein
VHPADAAGGEHRDPGEVRQVHRGGHRRPGGRLRGRQRAEVTPGRLGHVGPGQPLQLRRRQADPDPAVDQRHGGGNRAAVADDALDLDRRGQVLRVRHPMADDRRLQRDHGTPGRQRVGHLLGDDQPAGAVR